MLQGIVSSVLGQLATGILLFIAFVPTSRIGKGFGRFHSILALVFWILAFAGRFPVEFYFFAAVIFLVFLSSGKDIPFYIFLIVSLFLSFRLLLMGDIAHMGVLNALAHHVPPVLVLGASSVAMLLGHWYLVAPKLSIVYLKILTIGLILSLGIRSGLVLQNWLNGTVVLEQIDFYALYGIFFLQRVALGLILTLILSVMTYFCVRIRSTQSATGILYVVLVFSLVGELIGNYLFVRTGIPF